MLSGPVGRSSVGREVTRVPAFSVRRVGGRGLLLGLHLGRPAAELQRALFDRRMLTGTAADPRILRLLPPLSFSEGEAHLLLDGLGVCVPVRSARACWARPRRG